MPGDHVMTALLGEKDKTRLLRRTITDDGANNALAAIATIRNPARPRDGAPKGVTAPQMLDAATLDALSRTIGATEPLAHLAPASRPGYESGQAIRTRQITGPDGGGHQL